MRPVGQDEGRGIFRLRVGVRRSPHLWTRSSITVLQNDPACPDSSCDVLPSVSDVVATEGDTYFCGAMRVLECGAVSGEGDKLRRTIQVVDVVANVISLGVL